MEEEKVLLFSCEAGRKRPKRLDRLRVKLRAAVLQTPHNKTTQHMNVTGNPNERTLEANTTTDSQRGRRRHEHTEENEGTQL